MKYLTIICTECICKKYNIITHTSKRLLTYCIFADTLYPDEGVFLKAQAYAMTFPAGWFFKEWHYLSLSQILFTSNCL